MDTHREYLVRWEIELTAESAQDAARQALEVMRDPESQATHFKVSSPEAPLYGDFTDVDLGWEPCETCGEVHLNAICPAAESYKVWANVERVNGENYEELDGVAFLGAFETAASAIAFCKTLDPDTDLYDPSTVEVAP